MPILTAQITVDGPLVRLGVLVSFPREEALKAANLPVPPPQVVSALIDTGASCTVVDSAVIKALGIVATGQILIHTPSTGSASHPCGQYDVALAVLMPRQVHFVAATIPVIESDLSQQGIQALIGRDVLANAVLWYNGQDKTLSLAF